LQSLNTVCTRIVQPAGLRISRVRSGAHFRRRRLRAIPLTVMLAAVRFTGGCVSLNAQAEIKRSVDAVEQAVGVPAVLLLRDSATVEAATQELLAGGLTADEAVQVALLNSPRVRSAMLSIGVSRADFVQSTLFSNPSLFLSLRFPDSGGRPNVEVNLAQSIAELWLVPVRRKAAQRDLDRVVLEAARITSAVVLDTRHAYVRAVLADAQIDLAESGSEIAARLVEIAELRQQAGTGSEVDLGIARAQQLQAETDMRNARLAAVEMKADLARLLGLTHDPRELIFVDPLTEPAVWDVPVETLCAIARASRLDHKDMEQSVASAETLARIERVRFLRSVDVGFAFELAERRSRGDRNWFAEAFYDSLQSGAPTPPNLMPRERQGTNTIAGPTLSLELPLWDRNQAQIARADRLLEQTRWRRDALLIETAQEIHVSLARVRTATENARFFREKFVPIAERNVTLAQEAYRVGRAPFLSLLEAQRAYVNTRASQIMALGDAVAAEIDLERATGRPAHWLRDAREAPDDANENLTDSISSMESAR
jgi:cobalt-zinc-cadmium efflux system outer membrane protein